MQINFLKTLVEEINGENSGQIVDILFDKKDVNEFLIAKKMDLTINQVRNILYKLSAEGLVSFVRKKDKRKGWYIYYWTLDTRKCLIKLEESLIKKIKELDSLLDSRESKRFYVCNTCNIEVSEETALEHQFTCNECADVYELVEGESEIKKIKNFIVRKQKELKIIQNELSLIREKIEKKKAREDKKQEKEKAKEKAKKTRSKKRAKDKLKGRAKSKVKSKVKSKKTKKVKKQVVKKSKAKKPKPKSKQSKKPKKKKK